MIVMNGWNETGGQSWKRLMAIAQYRRHRRTTGQGTQWQEHARSDFGRGLTDCYG